MNEALTAGDVLREAVQLLQEKGHSKGHLLDSEGGVCAMGALTFTLMNHQLLGTPLSQQSTLALFRTVDKVRGRKHCNIVSWNDHPETTQADVEKVFLQAADAVDFQ